MRTLAFVMFAGASLAVWRAPLVGQQAFRAVTNGVVASAFVTKNGAPVDDLVAADFAVTDNTAPQTVTVTRDTRPLDVTLWLEDTEMTDFWTAPVRHAVEVLNKSLAPTDRVRVVVGGRINREVIPWQAPSASIADRLREASRQVTDSPPIYGMRGASAPTDESVFDTLMTLGPPERRQVVVSIFVGVFDLELGNDLLAATAASSEAVVYMMGLPPEGSIPPQWFAGVGRIASITGGELLVATDPANNGEPMGTFRVRTMPGVPVDFGGAIAARFEDATAAMGQVVNDVRHAYVLSFVPTQPSPGWHSIGVRVTRPNLEKAYVRARKQYFVAGK